MTCPNCGVTAPSYHGVDGHSHQAQEGCRGICLRCGLWWEFTSGHLVKYKPTMEEAYLVGAEIARKRRKAILKASMN